MAKFKFNLNNILQLTALPSYFSLKIIFLLEILVPLVIEKEANFEVEIKFSKPWTMCLCKVFLGLCFNQICGDNITEIKQSLTPCGKYKWNLLGTTTSVFWSEWLSCAVTELSVHY